MNFILRLVIMHLLAHITPHALHQCVDLVHQHLRLARHNHGAWKLFERYVWHAYISTPRFCVTVEATTRYVREGPEKCAARVQGDGTLRRTNVVRRHVRICARAGRYRCIVRIDPWRKQPDRHGRCGQSNDEARVLDQIANKGESEITPC